MCDLHGGRCQHQLVDELRSTPRRGARHLSPMSPSPASVDRSLRVWIDSADPMQAPWPKPYVRGLDHMVFLGFDSGSSMLADLRMRRVIGRFSAGMAADTAYWRTVIFPMLLSVLAVSVGLVELHASCVAKDQRGWVLIGPSGSGKARLAMAMTEAGFSFLSDDRIFCSRKQGRRLAWAMPRPSWQAEQGRPYLRAKAGIPYAVAPRQRAFREATDASPFSSELRFPCSLRLSLAGTVRQPEQRFLRNKFVPNSVNGSNKSGTIRIVLDFLAQSRDAVVHRAVTGSLSFWP